MCNINDRVGMRREVLKAWRPTAFPQDRYTSGESIERILQMLPRHGVRSPIISEQAQRFARELQRIVNSAQPLRCKWRIGDYLAAR